jgi:hypothetical protein
MTPDTLQSKFPELAKQVATMQRDCDAFCKELIKLKPGDILPIRRR